MRALSVEQCSLLTDKKRRGGLKPKRLLGNRSLDNMSGQIRWSLDLRWQRPAEPNGFYGLKDCITMAKAGDPGFRLDWGAWAAQDRTPLQKVALSADKSAEVSAAAAKEAQGDHSTPCHPALAQCVAPHQPLPHLLIAACSRSSCS